MLNIKNNTLMGFVVNMISEDFVYKKDFYVIVSCMLSIIAFEAFWYSMKIHFKGDFNLCCLETFL